MEEYNYEIVHRSGKTNAIIDALSHDTIKEIFKVEEEEEKEKVASKCILYEYHDAFLSGYQGIERTSTESDWNIIGQDW